MRLLEAQRGVYRPDFFGPEVLTVFSGREFPRDKFPDFLSALGIEPSTLVRLKQTHSAVVKAVDAQNRPSVKEEGDGLITRATGLALGVLTADCLPIFLWDPVSRTAGLIHAGWRGIQAGILEESVRKIAGQFPARAGNLKAALGPAIRKCCYEVGEEFREIFPVSYLEPQQGQRRGRVDLALEATHRLGRAGVDLAEIQDVGICTACSNSRFFSARCGDTDQRTLSVISIK